MGQCPKCTTQIEDGFGLVQCPKCKTMLVVDFEGNLKLTDEASFQAPFVAPIDDPVLPAEQVAQAPEWNFDEPQPTAQSSQSLSAPEILPLEKSQSSQIPEIQEINDFANSSASLAPEGILLYDLKIEGLDDIDTKNTIQDFIDDPRLKIDVKKVMATIKNGTLVIKNLNPVKASILISRIREVPVQISWTQNSTLASSKQNEKS